MADNYLEKQMEDYRRGRVSTTTVRRRRGYITLRYPERHLLFIGGDAPGIATIMQRLAEAGLHVSFTVGNATDTDIAAGAAAEGRRIAQATGARFYPGGIEAALTDLAARDESPDAICYYGCNSYNGYDRYNGYDSYKITEDDTVHPDRAILNILAFVLGDR